MCVSVFNKKIYIIKVTPFAGKGEEIIFYLQQNLNMDNRDKYGGLCFVVDIAFAENFYKLLNIWIEYPK